MPRPDDLFGEASLWHAVTEYVQHYHVERPHQGLGNVIPFPLPNPTPLRATAHLPRTCRDVREILLPFLSEFVGRLAGQLFPQVVAISALAHRRIHLRDDIRVIVLAHPVEEVCGGAITRVVSGAIRITNDGPV